MENLKRLKQVAIKAALAGGDELLKRFEKFERRDIRFKKKHEILTSADLASEKKIISIVRKNFKNHNILSEEAGALKNDSPYLWIIDPLDGTTNFSMHNPLWCVSIGVAFKKEVILGVIYIPFLNELYVAVKNQGAWFIKPSLSLKVKQIKVSTFSADKALHTFCHGNTQKDIKIALKYHSYQKLNNFDCRQLGSAAAELAFVSAGRTESIVIPGAKPWDIAAGVLLVREAGGKVSDIEGNFWNIDSRGVVASNNKVHKQVLNVVKKYAK